MLSIYKASAGSGKTFRLTQIYLKMLLGIKDKDTDTYHLNTSITDRHRHILAITFTNKATDEMKRRIVHELAVLAGSEPGWKKPSPYIADLCKELHCTAPQLAVAAKAALQQLLFDYNSFQVSTIDSFFQTILRTFAREADIAGNYEVELDGERAIGQGVKLLFDSLSTNSGSAHTRRLIDWITDHLLLRLRQGKKVLIFNHESQIHSELLKFISDISNDEFAQHYTHMMEFLGKPENLVQMATSINQARLAERAAIREKCTRALSYIESCAYITDKAKLNAHLINALQNGRKEAKMSDTVSEKAVADPCQYYTKALLTILDRQPDPELAEVIIDACSQYIASAKNLSILDDISGSLFALGLLERVYHYIEEYHSENNTILLSDTNTLLREIIGTDDPSFVYERVGLWINHFLIDEFQDTSKLQWEIMKPLIEEGISKSDDSLIIGDEKQCIYRFRFSDPTLLQSGVMKELSPRAQLIGTTPADNTNWRSSWQVVSFNNDFFSTLSKRLRYDNIYANVQQCINDDAANARDGYVALIGIPSAKVEEMHTVAFQEMYRNIRRQIASGYKPCEIAILTRFNNEGAAAIKYLMNHFEADPLMKGVSIVSDDAMEIGTSPAVRLIMSLLRFIAMPIDDDPEAPIDAPKSRRKRLREIGDLINRFENFSSKGIESSQALLKALRSQHLAMTDDITPGSMACFNIPGLVERIIAAYFSGGQVPEEQSMYVAAFVDMVNEYCSRGASDLIEFIKWWDDSGHTSKISGAADVNAIRVMTVHKSKGLEFKCVHIPLATWKMVKFKQKEWFEVPQQGLYGIPKDSLPDMLPLQPNDNMLFSPFRVHYARRIYEQLLDELNNLYVAFTRAIDELIVCYELKDPRPASIYDDVDTSLDSTLTISNTIVDTIPAMTLTPSPQPEEEEKEEEGEDAENQAGPVYTVYGMPTLAKADKIKPPTALEPIASTGMQPYATAMRNDLWDMLDIKRYVDYGVARDRGTILHDVMAHVTTLDSLPKAVKKSVYRRTLPAEEAAEVEQQLAELLSRHDVRPWFEGYTRLLCERPISLTEGTTTRPDRVVWTADGTVDIIDYKFGAERPALYSAQVAGYMQQFRKLGYDNVRGFIFYIDRGIIKQV